MKEVKDFKEIKEKFFNLIHFINIIKFIISITTRFF